MERSFFIRNFVVFSVVLRILEFKNDFFSTFLQGFKLLKINKL